MTYGRKNLKLIHKHGSYYPYYLDMEKDGDLVKDVIEFYENNIGKKYGDIDWDELRILIGDDRLYKAFSKVMNYFYKLTSNTISSYDPKILRIRVFQLVNKIYKGFVQTSERSKAIEVIKNTLGISPNEDLDSILWKDELDETVLTRIRKASVEDVIKIFNLETLDTIFVNSYKMFIYVNRNEKFLGALAKLVGRLSKLHGIAYDIRYDRDWLKIIVEGPKLLFKRAISSYGSRITTLVINMLPILYKSSQWFIPTYIYTSSKLLKIIVLSSNLKPELSLANREFSPREIFDSSIEESIYSVFRSLGLNVSREEEPIALGDLLYIPDFKISINGKDFYIEVVGYWRKEYIERKIFKLNEVSKIVNRIIVIADEKLKPFLDKLKLPIIYYTLSYGKPVLNYRKIIEIIKLNTD